MTEQINIGPFAHAILLAAWESWGTAARWNPEHGWHDPLEADRYERRPMWTQ